MKIRYPARSVKAFTLIELILAIGITAMVVVAINAVFFSAMRLRERTSIAVEESLPAQQAFATLRRDLQGAMPPSADGSGILSGDFRVGGVTSAGVGQPVDIELYTTTGVLRETDPWGEIQKVAYQLRPSADRNAPGKDLVRSATRNLLATMTAQPEDQLLMSGVDSIEFSCFDGSSWYNTWDSLVTTNLPNAVRVRIVLASSSANNGTRPLEMLVPIDSQVRALQNPNAETRETE